MQVYYHGGEVGHPLGSQPVRPSACHLFHLGLQAGIQRGADGLSPLRSVGPLYQVERQGREGLGRIGKGLQTGILVGLFINVSVVQQSLEQPVALGKQGLASFARMNGGRGIGQDSQGSGFGPGKIFRRNPEVAPCGSVQPHDVAPERGVRGIEGQDAFFGVAALQTGSQNRLDGFLPQGPFTLTGQADDLHGQGTAAAGHVAAAEVVFDGPADGQGIYPRMPAEMSVFELDKGRCIPGWNLPAGRETPLAVIGRPGAQENAATVRNDRGVGKPAEEVAGQAA